MDAWQHLRCSMKIEHRILRDDQTSRDDRASFGRSISNRTSAT